MKMASEQRMMMIRQGKQPAGAKSAWWMLVALMMVVGMPAMAQAQEGGAEEEGGLDVDGPLKEELTEYWSVERDLPMVNNKLYTREGRINVSVFAGIESTEPFWWYIPVGGRVGYFLTEQFAVEVGGDYEIARPTELTTFLETNREDNFDVMTDAEDKFVWRANAVASWHPLYGKWALLQRKLSHFDFSLVGGLGAVGLQRPSPTRDETNSKVAIEGIFGFGMHFFLTDSLTLRMDWRGHIYRGPEFDTAAFADQGFMNRFQLPTQFQLGVAYMF